jgi:hypothetical protein
LRARHRVPALDVRKNVLSSKKERHDGTSARAMGNISSIAKSGAMLSRGNFPSLQSAGHVLKYQSNQQLRKISLTFSAATYQMGELKKFDSNE